MIKRVSLLGLERRGLTNGSAEKQERNMGGGAPHWLDNLLPFAILLESLNEWRSKAVMALMKRWLTDVVGEVEQNGAWGIYMSTWADSLTVLQVLLTFVDVICLLS